MRRKQFWMGIAAAIISISASFTAFAGEWKQDNAGWWYDFGDTTYAKDGWHWVDGKCYYFTPEGYCLLNTTTPDGYTVDASGAWTVDGVVQVQAGGTDNQEAAGEVYQLGNLTFTKPADYRFETVQDTIWQLSKEDDSQILMISSSESEISDGMLSEEELGKRNDNFMLRNSGAWDSKEIVELTSGKWFAYVYSAETTRNGYHDKRYLRLKNNRVEMIILGSRDANMDKDGFLNQYIR